MRPLSHILLSRPLHPAEERLRQLRMRSRREVRPAPLEAAVGLRQHPPREPDDRARGRVDCLDRPQRGILGQADPVHLVPPGLALGLAVEEELVEGVREGRPVVIRELGDVGSGGREYGDWGGGVVGHCLGKRTLLVM